MNTDQLDANAEAYPSEQDARTAAEALHKWARALSNAKIVAEVLEKYTGLKQAQRELELAIEARRAELAQIKENIARGDTEARDARTEAEGRFAARLAAVQQEIDAAEHRCNGLLKRETEVLQRLAAAEERERELQSKRSELLRSLEGA